MNDRVRHACTTWWGRLGILGGLVVVVAAACLGPWMLLVSEASTCSAPYTFAQGGIPTAAQWNANPSYMCTLWNNGIDDTNVVAGANIAQSKLALLTTNPLFTDHSLRHENGGGDEIEDLEILETGTLLSLHGSRHAPDTGLDPIPGLTGIIGTRHKYVSDAGLQANVAFTNVMTTPYKSSTVANSTVMGITHCGGFIYALIDDIGGGDQNFVRKIATSTMTLSATINLAVAGGTPRTILCGADDSVYTLSDTGATDGVKVEKITPAGAVSTLTSGASCTALDLDAAVTMITDPSSSNLYVLGSTSIAAMAKDRLIIKVTTGGVCYQTQDPRGNVDDDYTDLFFFNRNGTDYVGVQSTNLVAGGAKCLLVVYNTDSPPQYQAAGDFGGAPFQLAGDTIDGPNDCRAFEFDGTFLTGIEAGAGQHRGPTTFNVATLTIAKPDGSGTSAPFSADVYETPERMFFDGRRTYIQSNAKYTFIVNPPNYLYPDAADKVAGQDFSGGIVGTLTPCGMATDGINMYFCTKDSIDPEFIIVKILAL